MVICSPSFTSRAFAAFLATAGWAVASQADPVSLRVPLSGMEELPRCKRRKWRRRIRLRSGDPDHQNGSLPIMGYRDRRQWPIFTDPLRRAREGPVVIWAFESRAVQAESPLTGQT